MEEKVIVYVLPRAGSRTCQQVFVKAGIASIHHHEYQMLFQAKEKGLTGTEFKKVYEQSIQLTIGKAYNDPHNLFKDLLLAKHIQFDCEPNLMLVCKELNEVYPKARKIHMIRHPKDWIASMSRWGLGKHTWVDTLHHVWPVGFPDGWSDWDTIGKLTWAYYVIHNYIMDCGVEKTFKIEHGFHRIFRHLNLPGFRVSLNEVREGGGFYEKEYMYRPENWTIKQHETFEQMKEKYQGNVPSYGNPNLPKLMKLAVQMRRQEYEEKTGTETIT